jgi:hypothetical protein
MMLWRVPAGTRIANPGVDLCTDIFTGLKAHHDELAILRRIQDRAERRVLLRCLFYAANVAFHGFSCSFGYTPR